MKKRKGLGGGGYSERVLSLVAERSYPQIILTRQTVRTCMCVSGCVCVCPTQTSKIFLLFPCTTPNCRYVVPPFKRLSSPQKLISIFYLLQFFDFAFPCSRSHFISSVISFSSLSSLPLLPSSSPSSSSVSAFFSSLLSVIQFVPSARLLPFAFVSCCFCCVSISI